MAVAASDIGRHSGVVSDHLLTGRILAELKWARSKLERALSPRSRLFPAVRALTRMEQRLSRALRLAICGEHNSGKSSLANLLGGIESLPTAAVSNTRIPTLLYHAPEPEIWAVCDTAGRRARLRADHNTLAQSVFRLEVGLPSQRLRGIEILDFPGLPGPAHVDLALHAVDAALWCTVSTQAWKESERLAWNELPARLRSCGLLVSTHADLLADARDREKLLTRLRRECDSVFRDIVMVSTLDARGADALDAALASLIAVARDRRASSALRVIGRITHRALAQMQEP
jgi:50S ribosomal subunit-associated GTPase HflX